MLKKITIKLHGGVVITMDIGKDDVHVSAVIDRKGGFTTLGKTLTEDDAVFEILKEDLVVPSHNGNRLV